MGKRDDAGAGFVGVEAEWTCEPLPVSALDEGGPILAPDLLCHPRIGWVVEMRECRCDVVERSEAHLMTAQ